MRKIILFELNEVPFRVIDFYCEKYPASTLAKILPKCKQFQTLTDDEGHLHPWTTWPTFHRGISNEVHHIKDFGEDLSELDKTHPPIWKILVNHNVSVGVFASMHSYPLPANVANYAFYVPDPFASGSECHPKSIEPFQAFNLSMARRSGRNVDSGIDTKSAMKLALQLPKLGIKANTIKSTLGQLVEERSAPWKATRRRTYQSVLAFDIFMKLLKQHKPQFVTYLSNHVAATMHRYWAATFPKDYEVNHLSDDWMKTYSGEIDFAMHKFDSFLKRLVAFTEENPEYQLIVASSMGQEATTAEVQLTSLTVKDMPKFMTALGMEMSEWETIPAMHPQYNVQITSTKSEERFIQAIKRLQIKGNVIDFRQKEGGFFSLDLGHANLEDHDVTLDGQNIALDGIGLENEKVDEEASGTAYHIPEGSLFIYDPQNTQQDTKRQQNTNTKAFAPSILKNFGITIPEYMSKERINPLS